MFFTQEDYRKIESWLAQRAIKDSQLNEADPLEGKDLVPIVQGGKNKVIPFHWFISQLNDNIIVDFYNVSDRHNVHHISLSEAINYIPCSQMRTGLVVTFINECGNWEIAQFKGESIAQWNTPCLWRDLFEASIEDHIYYPDEEDIAGIQEGKTKILRLKDREFDAENFSGKGRVILRKNLHGTEACSIDDEDHYVNILSQDDFPYENTTYIVRYDYTAEGFISMPKGCEIVFEGGHISGGVINLNGCKLSGMIGPESDYFTNTELSNWAEGQVEYREGLIQFWSGTEWLPVGSSRSYTKGEMDEILKKYRLKSDSYSKSEIDNTLLKYVTKTELNNTITELSNYITNVSSSSLTLDAIQTAINKGCDVDLSLPSDNNGKLLLPIWTGTKAEYELIQPKVSGMTYNIID